MHYVFLYTDDDKRFKITYTDISIQINKVYLHISDYGHLVTLYARAHRHTKMCTHTLTLTCDLKKRKLQKKIGKKCTRTDRRRHAALCR